MDDSPPLPRLRCAHRLSTVCLGRDDSKRLRLMISVEGSGKVEPAPFRTEWSVLSLRGSLASTGIFKEGSRGYLRAFHSRRRGSFVSFGLHSKMGEPEDVGCRGFAAGLPTKGSFLSSTTVGAAGPRLALMRVLLCSGFLSTVFHAFNWQPVLFVVLSLGAIETPWETSLSVESGLVAQ